ncbi:MAG: helix-turn-helix domain-containing protein [Clostridia bacterium]|nr:helix-turn-helix domain-containing protein [Clostridia bacterium]
MPTSGRRFQFDMLYESDKGGDARRFGAIDLFQAGDVSYVSGYEIPSHKQWCHEISYIISGEGYFTTDNETDLLVEGDIHFCPAGKTHAIRTANGSDLRYAYIGFSFNEKADQNEEIRQLKEYYEKLAYYKVTDSHNLVVPLFRNLDELYGRESFYTTMVEAYLIQMLVLVYRCFDAQPKSEYFPPVSEKNVSQSMYAVAKYIDKHIFETINVQKLAQEIGYNYSYLSDAFCRCNGITIRRYISNRKIQKAIELMCCGKLSVVQVSNRLQYATVQSFSKAFKRTMGCSPTEFLRQQAAGKVPAAPMTEVELPSISDKKE